MQVNLDLTGASVNTGKTVLPTGLYNSVIAAAEVKETSKNGHGLVVTFKVEDGDHAGKQFDDFLNINNTNPDTVKWALNSLKTILTKGGHPNPNHLADTNELLGLRMKVSVEEYADSYVKDGVTKETTNNKIMFYASQDGNPSVSNAKLEVAQSAAVAAPVVAPVAAPVAVPAPQAPVVAQPAPVAPAPQPAQQQAPAQPAAAPAASAAFPWNAAK